MSLRSVSLKELRIDDERALAGVEIYRRLARVVAASSQRFWVPDEGAELSWDRAVFLNLTYWSDAEGADVLCEARIPGDVVAHIGWHEVVRRHLAGEAATTPSSPDGLFFAESLASAFDLYLVGRLMRSAPDSDFIATQVPLMAERAANAGLGEAAFERLIEEVVRAPERAFEDMRALLLDVSRALFACRRAADAARALAAFDGHRFAPLLHHFELSNWILFARAYGGSDVEAHPTISEVDAALRQAPDALAWLMDHWVEADGGPVTGVDGLVR